MATRKRLGGFGAPGSDEGEAANQPEEYRQCEVGA
jgi:hypothetical protein